MRVAWLLLALVVVPACGSGGGGGTQIVYLTVPTVTGVSPDPAREGDDVRVVGAGFGASQGTSTLTVSGVAATVITWSDTSIRAIVPTGAVPGDVVVTVNGTPGSPGHLYVLIDSSLLVSTGASSLTPCVLADGAGGMIVAWQDDRHGAATSDLFAARFDAAGNSLWGTRQICTAVGLQYNAVIIPDGAGGAIIAWNDSRAGNSVYAQRVDGGGIIQWAFNGVPVCNTGFPAFSVLMVPDGSGGALLGWLDLRNANMDVFAQRIDGTGAALWAANGVPVSQAADVQFLTQMVADVSGGAIFVWQDFRNGTDNDIFAQRLNSAGAPQWTADGIPIVGGPTNQDTAVAVTDGAGGAIIAWTDLRNGNKDLFAQRVDGAGTLLWTGGGVAICTAAHEQSNLGAVSDGVGGAILGWLDYRTGAAEADVYAQRVNASGAVQWAANGVAVTTALGNQFLTSVISDGAQGAILVWQDRRNGSDDDVYAQRINGSGQTAWTPDGVVLCAAVNDQSGPVAASNGAGGAVVAWADYRLQTLIAPDGIRIMGQYVTAAGVRY